LKKSWRALFNKFLPRFFVLWY